MDPQVWGWHPMAGLCPPLAGLAAGKGWQGGWLGTGLCRGPRFWPNPLAEVGARAVGPGRIRNQLRGIPTVPWHVRVPLCMPVGRVAAPWMPTARAELAPRWAQHAPSKAVCPGTCRPPCLPSYPTPAPAHPLPIPCPSALVSSSQMPAEPCPIEGLCPAALGHICPLHASPWCGAVHPGSPPCTPQAGLGAGGALGDVGCASSKPRRVTPRGTLPETSAQPWLGSLSPAEAPESRHREGVSAISSDTHGREMSFPVPRCHPRELQGPLAQQGRERHPQGSAKV